MTAHSKLRRPDVAKHPGIQERYRRAITAATSGLFVNIALGVTKIVGGIVANSFALIADAVNSLGDVLTSTVIIGALILAQRPPTERHPYGYARVEAVTATNIALVVFLSALLLGWSALQRFGVVHERPPTWTLWIAGANVAIKEFLYHYKIRVGRQTSSAVIVANAWDHRSDALAASAVLVGLAAVRLGGLRFIWADEAAAMVVVCLIGFASAVLFRDSVRKLLDEQAEPEVIELVRDVALKRAEVKNIETLRVRRNGLEYLVDIHVQVDPTWSVRHGHATAHQVRDDILGAVPGVRDVLVHLEPFEPPS